MKTPSIKPLITKISGSDFAISDEGLQILMRAILAKGASFQFRARGLSMTPFIKDGDVITIAPFAKKKPSLGNVVAFIQPASGHLVVHRVIARQGEAFLIQGDNASGQPDGLVSNQEILGYVIRVERNHHQVYLGQGPERYLIAKLARNGRLTSLLNRLRILKNKTPA